MKLSDGRTVLPKLPPRRERMTMIWPSPFRWRSCSPGCAWPYAAWALCRAAREQRSRIYQRWPENRLRGGCVYLEGKEPSPQYIQTHIGVGYRMIKWEIAAPRHPAFLLSTALFHFIMISDSPLQICRLLLRPPLLPEQLKSHAATHFSAVHAAFEIPCWKNETCCA